MKSHITWRELKEQYPIRIKCGYCVLQDFLYNISPDYYHSGIYGWDADIYILDSSTVLVTGYRPRGNYIINNDFCCTLNENARRFRRLHNVPIENQKRLLLDCLEFHNVIQYKT